MVSLVINALSSNIARHISGPTSPSCCPQNGQKYVAHQVRVLYLYMPR